MATKTYSGVLDPASDPLYPGQRQSPNTGGRLEMDLFPGGRRPPGPDYLYRALGIGGMEFGEGNERNWLNGKGAHKHGIPQQSIGLNQGHAFANMATA